MAISRRHLRFPPGWLGDPDLRRLFAVFPLALAVVEDGGRRVLNDRFEALVGAQALEGGPLAALLASSDRGWQDLVVDRAGRPALRVRACTAHVGHSRLVILEEAPQTEADVAALKGRVKDLEKLSATDALTGLWNRGHLDRTIEAELSRSHRFRQPISLVLLDVDHFKRVNDQHGHAAGDAVLCELVRALSSALRGADLVFRWGGEEFVVLVASTGYRAAAVLAEKLRAAVERHAFPAAGRVTVSIGVAEHLGTESATEWFVRLDQALYAAKAAGRNRVQVDRRGNSDAWGRADSEALRLQWSDAYQCGDERIDDQHRELFELANDLLSASAAALRDQERERAAYQRLLTHIRRHFQDEEELLARLGYPRLGAHARAHARILARADELSKEAELGELAFGDVVEFVASEVVSRHLFTADRDFFPLLAAQGS
jgi:diguanylate cyclase (GGDEF)-like protein/hemerythrin-like metal-binding protein